MNLLALTYQDRNVPLAHSHSGLPRTPTCWTARHLLAHVSLHTHAHRKDMHGTSLHSPHAQNPRSPPNPCACPRLCALTLGPHPDNLLPSAPGTHTTLMQSPFYTLHIPGPLNAGSSSYTHIHTHTRTHTRAHTCSHTTITPRSLDPQLPQLRAARPDGPGGSWWGKMSSGCPDGRSHTGT